MRKVLKQEKGITMLSVVITVILLIILSGILIFNTKDTVEIASLTNLYNDIDLLNDKVSEYYNEYGKIPAEIEYTNIDELQSVLSRNNDIGGFYVIDLEAMQGITLNYGKDYETIKKDSENANNYKDVYIINENSHNIFYVQGIEITDNDRVVTKYYTTYSEPDETVIDLRYVNEILIPDGYTYKGEVAIDNGTGKSMMIEKDGEEYVWQKKQGDIEAEELANIELSEDPSEDALLKIEFQKSVEHYKGYFKNRDETKRDVVYLTVKENKWSEPYTKNGKYTDKNGDVAYIPKGFMVSLAEGTNEVRNGLVITDEIDTETNESIGNEFVWIPVNYFDDFTREDLGNTIDPFTTNSITPTAGEYYEITANGSSVNTTGTDEEKEVQEMYKCVKDYKGFYIGRYETGIAVDTPRGSGSTKQDAVIKKANQRYNYVAFQEALTVSREMYTKLKLNSSNNQDTERPYKTTLCYGVQWDSIIRWVNKDNATKSTYDLSGNLAEWTMEYYGTTERIVRGGGVNPITYRQALDPSTKTADNGFRIALYIK